MNRIAITAAIAVMVASLSMSSVIASGGWIATGAGAIVVIAIAGALTRLPKLPAAVVATFLVLLALVPLLTRPGWPDRIAALVILAITALSATGARPLRGFAVLACYLATLLLYLNVTFAHASSLGHIIPSDNSLQVLGQLWRAAFEEFRYAPPVPDLSPVSLVTAAGIGAVAIAVDILAVQLRQPAVAGLPLLLLFSVPVASNLKVFGAPQMIVFAASLASYLALLSADGRERLRMWGRLVTFRHVQSADETGSGPDTRELSASGRRIGLAAVCLAIVIPVILPSMRVRDLFATTADGTGRGGGSAGVSPLLNFQKLLEGKAQPVLSYTTTAKDPSQQYFQVYALNYNARQNDWPTPVLAGTHASAGQNLPAKVPGVARTTLGVKKVTTRITISQDDKGEAILPMPYAPYRLDIDGPGWLETDGSLTVFNPERDMPGLQYVVHSDEVDPQPGQIPNLGTPYSIGTEYGRYNGPNEAQLYRIALAHTSGAATQLQEADDLEKWFLSGAFSYSLKPGLPATNWLVPFLTHDRRGFCVQFAQAFAILARTLGIPSRIAIGYTGGTPESGGKTWQVTTADAHAWPELYFTGEGWLRFEPTPSGSHGQGTAVPPIYAAGPGSTTSRAQDLTPHSTATSPADQGAGSKDRPATGRNVHLAETGAASATKHADSKLGLAIAIPAAVFLLIAWPALTRLLTRRRRWFTASGDAATAHAAWRELTDDLADYGLGCAPGETPRAVARRVTRQARLDETATRAVSRLAAAEERARYARLPDPAGGLMTAVVTVRRAVAAAVPLRQRLRARLLPSSTLLAARHLFQRASEMLGWIDSSLPTLRRRQGRAANRAD